MPKTNRSDLLALYIFQCNCADIADRIRTLKGARVRPDMVIPVTCRLVWRERWTVLGFVLDEDDSTLFRADYRGFPEQDDDSLLLAMMAVDEKVFPGDYGAESNVAETVRRVQPLPDDNDEMADFIEPAIGSKQGNTVKVPRRTVRLRDRVTVSELDFISDWYRAHRANGDGLKQLAGAHRWLRPGPEWEWIEAWNEAMEEEALRVEAALREEALSRDL